VLPVLCASLSCAVLKRAFGRIRPNRPNAGRFTGPAWKHDAKRESFPSSHSACAMALTVTMSAVWPDAAPVFWLLAFVTAILRYLQDAHFPSDVAGGVLLGLTVAKPAMDALEPVLFPK
jgi:membrane-associated phospholipid phosphatase